MKEKKPVMKLQNCKRPVKALRVQGLGAFGLER
jgi:hypothetical protein